MKPRVEINTLKFEDVTFAYENESPIFKNVSFDFPMNSNVLVKASTGSGRSTLLQMLAGLSNPQSGKYLINGEDISDMSFDEFLPIRLNVGFSFDSGGLLHNRTMLENISLPLVYHKILDTFDALERALDMMEFMGIKKYQGLRPSVVPGSIRKLCVLLRSIIVEPQLLLLDDPSVGLTQETILKFFDLVNQQRSAGKVRHVFISSYDEKLMSVIDHNTVVIDQGQLYQFATEGEKKVVHL